MSGLRNVLGNVYGNEDDKPQETNLSDVQESMDALVEGATSEDEASAEPGETAPEEAAEQGEPSALDDLADWVGSDEPIADDEAVAIAEEGDDIFANDGPVFLDDEPAMAEEQPVAEAAAPPSMEETQQEQEPDAETAGPERAGWLDALDSEGGPSWMDDLDDEDPEIDDPIAPSAMTAIETEPASSSIEAELEDDHSDEAPTLDDIVASPAPAPRSAVPPDPDEDEQWLDDLFGTDSLTESDAPGAPDTQVSSEPLDDPTPVGADQAEATDPVDDVPVDHAVSVDQAAPDDHSIPSGESIPEPIEPAVEEPPIEALLPDLVDSVDKAATPVWHELQDSTAEASAVAAATPNGSVSSPIVLAGDWIRADDDILPTKRRAKRRSGKDELAGLATDRDPIEMFSPAESPSPRTKKTPKAKKAPKEEQAKTKPVKAKSTNAKDKNKNKAPKAKKPKAKTKKGPRGRKAKLQDEQAAPEDSPASPTQTDVQSAANAVAAEVTDPPVIADAGMPEAPEAIDAFFEADFGLEDVGAKKSKRKRFKKS